MNTLHTHLLFQEVQLHHDITLACEAGNISLLYELLYNGSRSSFSLPYATPGQNYCSISSIEAISYGKILDKVKSMGGFTPLHHACNRNHADMVNELLKLNVNINVSNDNNETPLHLAVYNGSMLIVEQLLDRGANINCVNIYNETPLLYASRRSKPALIRLLLERGADRTVKDNYGDAAEDHADDEPTRRAFLTQQVDQTGKLPYKLLLYIFQYLNAKDVCKSACVCGKWHRVSENPLIWSSLGIRRWELSLKSSLGFTTAPINLSYRPSNNRRPSKEKNSIITSENNKGKK